jgi:hypothetical protein
MFGFRKPKPQPHVADEFKAAVDAAIDAALQRGAKPDSLANALETRIDDLRMRSALTWSHPSVGVNRCVNDAWAMKERERLAREGS